MIWIKNKAPRRQRPQEGCFGPTPRRATSDVAKEKRAKADEDAAIEVKRQIGHEPSDIRLRGLVWTGVATVVIAVLTSVALYGLLQFFQSQPSAAQPPSALKAPTSLPPAPRLQTDPVADWQTLQATEQATLSSYGWADRGAGKARIPIDRAIELLIQRGLPVAPGSTRQFNDRTPNLDSTGGREPAPTSVAATPNTGQTQPEPAAETPTPGH